MICLGLKTRKDVTTLHYHRLICNQTAVKISCPQIAQLELIFCARSKNPPRKKFRVSCKAVKHWPLLLIIKLQKSLQPPTAVTYVRGSVTIIPSATLMGVFSLPTAQTVFGGWKRGTVYTYIWQIKSFSWLKRYIRAHRKADISPDCISPWSFTSVAENLLFK